VSLENCESYLVTTKLPLRNNRFTLIDDSDLPLVSEHRLYFNAGNGYVYAHRKVDGKKIDTPIHRLLLQPPTGLVCDHINGDKLDNRRANLRVTTQSNNRRNSVGKRTNTSGFKGVVWAAFNNKWRAQIFPNGKTVSIGYFDDPAEAARAYDARARQLYGEFARTNFSG
jgi:hypothetical protein